MTFAKQVSHICVTSFVSFLMASTALHADNLRQNNSKKRPVRPNSSQNYEENFECNYIAGNNRLIPSKRVIAYYEDHEHAFDREHAFTRHQREQVKSYIHNTQFFYQKTS